MSWTDADFAEAFVDAGMWVLADVAVAFDGGTAYTDIKVSLRGPDTNIFESEGQATDWHLEYQTDDLPGLATGDTVTVNGTEYTVRTTPRISGQSRYFSSCTVQPVVVAYPKASIAQITGAL